MWSQKPVNFYKMEAELRHTWCRVFYPCWPIDRNTGSWHLIPCKCSMLQRVCPMQITLPALIWTAIYIESTEIQLEKCALNRDSGLQMNRFWKSVLLLLGANLTDLLPGLCGLHDVVNYYLLLLHKVFALCLTYILPWEWWLMRPLKAWLILKNLNLSCID